MIFLKTILYNVTFEVAIRATRLVLIMCAIDIADFFCRIITFPFSIACGSGRFYISVMLKDHCCILNHT